MKFTLSWLKDFLDTTASTRELSEKLTAIGLEVESVTDRAADLAPFTVAHILAAKKHPEADRLRVCRVMSDIGELQIVCGAPNARAGLKVALAKEGAVIPGSGIIIKKSKIRGVESNGMLCSAEELALPGDGGGIIELPESAQIGASVAHVLGVEDPLFDINVTPNRGDALSVYGIARDLAAAGIGFLKDVGSEIKKLENLYSAIAQLPILGPILASPHCPFFMGISICGVHAGESPQWLKQKLLSIGQKPISSLVDITNFMTIAYGRPLHVYDADKLRGAITVRDALAGEKLTALNGKEYHLQPGMLVIADDSGPIGIAGIIGGAHTACDEKTKNVFLEAALFDPVSIAMTGRSLDILSDARYRFERGVDPSFVEIGAKIAAKMIIDLCGGDINGRVAAGNIPQTTRSIAFRASRVATLGGTEISREKIQSILGALGFSYQANSEGWDITPPSFRPDIEGEADLVEEVLRIHGYDQIAPVLLPFEATGQAIALPLLSRRSQLARRLLASRGMLETCNWTFVAEAEAARFGGANPQLKLLNPISAELDVMRPSLLPGLLQAAKKNAYRNLRSELHFFEAGLQFIDVTPQGQRSVAAGIRAVHMQTVNYNAPDRPFERKAEPPTAFDSKADALSLLDTLGVSKCDITASAPSWYHPGRCGTLMLGSKIILGYFGELHPSIASAYGLENESIAAFEIFLDAIPVARAKSKANAALKLSPFQTVERDFAFLVDSAVGAADILKTLAQADKQLIKEITLFDVYTGKNIPEGKKSVALKVTLQAEDRTLSEQDINEISGRIISAADKGFKGSLRQ